MKKPNVNHNGNHSHFGAREALSAAVQDDGFEPLLDSEEAAALLKIHPKTLQKLARSGDETSCITARTELKWQYAIRAVQTRRH